MPNTFIKNDYSEEKTSIYVNKIENQKFKVTLGDGERISVLNEKQAKDLRFKLGLVLDK